jgi:hypothetical protein
VVAEVVFKAVRADRRKNLGGETGLMRPNRRKTSLMTLAAVLGVLALVVVQTASATHVRPRGATPLRAAMVPSFKACASPNRTHGTPLAFPSCNPPVQTSNFLTVGSPDANGAGANAQAFILLTVKSTSPEDVLITASGTDVRCKPATAATVCNSANAADGPDYSGQLQGTAQIRISDHYNGPTLTEAATVVDIPFPVGATCVNTAATTIGGTCSANTSANAVVPGSVKDAQRGVVELGQLQINDGGADGNTSTLDNTLFAVQGVFIP